MRKAPRSDSADLSPSSPGNVDLLRSRLSCPQLHRTPKMHRLQAVCLPHCGWRNTPIPSTDDSKKSAGLEWRMLHGHPSHIAACCFNSPVQPSLIAWPAVSFWHAELLLSTGPIAVRLRSTSAHQLVRSSGQTAPARHLANLRSRRSDESDSDDCPLLSGLHYFLSETLGKHEARGVDVVRSLRPPRRCPIISFPPDNQHHDIKLGPFHSCAIFPRKVCSLHSLRLWIGVSRINCIRQADHCRAQSVTDLKRSPSCSRAVPTHVETLSI
ncbi:hypothetical protein BDW60DRAFT_43506 [Aspergillus nidulans var. acristatus]